MDAGVELNQAVYEIAASSIELVLPFKKLLSEAKIFKQPFHTLTN